MSVKSRRKAIASQLFHTRASHRPQGRAGARLRFPAAPVPFLRTPTAPKRFLLLPARDPFPQPAPAQIHFPTPLLSSSGTGAAQPQLMLLPSPIWSLAPPVTADPFPTPHLIPTQHLLPSPLPSSDGHGGIDGTAWMNRLCIPAFKVTPSRSRCRSLLPSLSILLQPAL
ncbi:hypothetical protein PVAP13_1KG157010 [Panicum virgatum]|uniref:Uncharacterized protein n=1 Tax=Panicum virgatum TaxID=38727 RepID=A0A8T0XQI9_PANVG|nr:hypothetical protein PVAP13_1KG157010 [Panicum virgatum]